MAYERRFVKLAISASSFVPQRESDPDDIVAMLLCGAALPSLPQDEYVERGLHYIDSFSSVFQSALEAWRRNPLSEIHSQRDDVVRGLHDHLEQHREICMRKYTRVLRDAWFAARYRAPLRAPRYCVRIDTFLAADAATRQRVGLTPAEEERGSVFGKFVTNAVSYDVVKAGSWEDAMNLVARRIGYSSTEDLVTEVERRTGTLVQMTAILIDGGDKENRHFQFEIDRKGSKLSLSRQVERGEIEVGALCAFSPNKEGLTLSQ
jgi:hypothetical protein